MTVLHSTVIYYCYIIVLYNMVYNRINRLHLSFSPHWHVVLPDRVPVEGCEAAQPRMLVRICCDACSPSCHCCTHGLQLGYWQLCWARRAPGAAQSLSEWSRLNGWRTRSSANVLTWCMAHHANWQLRAAVYSQMDSTSWAWGLLYTILNCSVTTVIQHTFWAMGMLYNSNITPCCCYIAISYHTLPLSYSMLYRGVMLLLGWSYSSVV